MKLKSKKNIQTLGKHLEVYPSLDALFTEEQRWLTVHFVPLISIDLAVLNKEWAGQCLTVISPIEPPPVELLGEGTLEYHNDYTSINWLTFKLTDDNRYIFLGEEGYFKRTAIHHWDFESEQEKEYQNSMLDYYKNKEYFATYGAILDIMATTFEKRYITANFIEQLGGVAPYGFWSSDFEVMCPPAFDMRLNYNNGRLANSWIEMSYKGNPIYHIAKVSSGSWGKYGGDVLLFYEPISRMVLLTLDY